MDENEVLIGRKSEMLFPFVITQAVCVALILLTILATKLFFKGTYNKAKIWYEKNICVDTTIESVLEATTEEGKE